MRPSCCIRHRPCRLLPDDRFRINKRAEFINADTNSVDEELSAKYTEALKNAGFIFPGKFISGKLNVLKPFDEGVFLKDSKETVFYLKRVEGEPKIVKTQVAPEGSVRFIKVTENKRKEFYGLLLSNNDEVFILTYDNYGLIPFSLKGFPFSFVSPLKPLF